MIVRISNGPAAKLRKPKTTYLTGEPSSVSHPRWLPFTDKSAVGTARSLGERYGLRIIPGSTSFLVLPNNVSRSTAVGAVLHPGGPAHSPQMGRAPWMSAEVEVHAGQDLDFVLAVSSDEKLLRRLNEFDDAETCSTRGKGTDARWKLDPREVVGVLWQFVNVS